MRRINISVVNADPILNLALHKIAGEQLHLVGGAVRITSKDELITGVLDIARGTTASDRPCKLDLIAHARHGELHLSKWLISATEEASESLRDQLDKGTIDEIRLLGCLTAGTVAGRAAMRHLSNVLRVRVFGTTSLIAAGDFGDSGFESDEFLIEQGKLPPGDPSLTAGDTGWFRLDQVPAIDRLEEQLRPETEDDARADALNYAPPSRWLVKLAGEHLGDLAALLSKREADLRVAPGLLLLPDAEVLFPAPSAGGTARYFRVTSLLNGRFLRVYPNGHPDGVLFRPSEQVLL